MAGDPLLRHIRHAEDWLRRARHDWRSGNAPAAVLRLMLAEAEIRHARETGAEGVAQRRSAATSMFATGGRAGWSRAAAVVAAAAVLAAGLGYASMRTGLPRGGALAVRDGAAGPGGGGTTQTIVQLDSGQFLMPDRGQTVAGGPGGPGLAVPRPRAVGGDGPGSAGLLRAVPVDLRTPSPTF